MCAFLGNTKKCENFHTTFKLIFIFCPGLRREGLIRVMNKERNGQRATNAILSSVNITLILKIACPNICRFQ